MMIKKLSSLNEEDLDRLLRRDVGIQDVISTVNDILTDVAQNGDEALRRYTKRFDGADLEEILVSEDELGYAAEQVDGRTVEALEAAAENIYSFHGEQRSRDLWFHEVSPGVLAGQKTVPLDSVGAYVPGGRAAYPSSALMNVIPARVAGVPRIAVCTPPASDGTINPLTLVAADIAGADLIYKAGGVQAIAALAFGTESVERVDKIVGPGNVYVTAAKMLVRNSVEIDFPAGPSEVLIVADSSADPAALAADMLAQAEHDPSSISVLVAIGELVAEAVAREVALQTSRSSRRGILEVSLERSAFLVAEDVDEAMDFSNHFAPEHLELVVRDPMEAFEMVRHAGSVFLGPYTPVAAGDYASGTNHVLPTSGYARAISGLNVDHFVKKITVQKISKDGLIRLGESIITLAEAEGLTSHADSVRRRLQQD
ncbi:MAG: bifunctional histidinal dehydrogenase/ histidinol dehydrogenase [Methanosaeta sp. PtaB.Bin039]|nr:MAG: bifunctional histidinal dehydrogenase/ histidinol dehydrogenase [Methanosaeta sp. PtaB.Bin039]HOT07636.1 histidinol dehydrogenase [Methanotrichaceae archaeon]HQF15684.1 histidinol dehydrogenase [Methanotrichaceae archaeon]HQI90420.1 histidinol dehydrogenase [Methanotrichaceae archaeon]HQJ28974.1 histidinol dehydrogenase [Methanotrichaceae archaeon]